MARQQLAGTLEEQAAQLYEMAQEAMAEGRYSGAYRYLQEIERALPGFRDVPQLLAQANYARREQRFLLLSSLAGGIALIVLARLLGAQSEWLLFGSAVVGLVLGFLAGLPLFRLIAGCRTLEHQQDDQLP